MTATALSPEEAGAKPPRRQRLGKGAEAAAEEPEAQAGEPEAEGEVGGKGRKKGGGGGGKKKGQAVAKRKAKEGTVPSSLMTLLMKAVLSSMQGNRMLSGVLLEVVVLKSEAKPVAHMLQQGRNYAAKTKEAGRGHGLGPPHVYIASGLLKGLMEEQSAIGKKNHDLIVKFSEQFEGEGIEGQCDMVKICRADQTYQGDMHKITLHFAAEQQEALRAILSALQQLDGQRKLGRAPKGPMERELEEWLRSWQEI